ncbi:MULTISPECIES: hypothetical protein [Halococcus]|jgi:hypothetical protein|uniref:Uncharacterized protein n=2 Tax=Halococcus TaxID=2249 RepID=M0NGF0_9EURY|nr:MULTISPECIES: hypothetical protein [Halococcus]EMA56623.1 hypothetical protein C451_01323 [Halococcus thailandensis JCM 13552]UOO96587.1 hypothetical protein MUK72_15435 [Halococcus dombrowskii]
MTIDQKRETVVSLLRKTDRDHHHKGSSTASLRALTYTAKSTRLGRCSVERAYSLLTSYQTGTWGVTADQLRDRLRIDALGVAEYDDPFDGQPFRSAELDRLIEQLHRYREVN